MWRIEKRARVFLALEPADMRKSINGLGMLVEQELDGRLFSGDLFVFSNRRRNLVKILYYDRNGFCIWQKRLAKHRFAWPQSEAEVMEIRKHQLAWLLDGLDIRQAHERLKYEIMA
jgi:transposase